jgi:hypothetical protein
MTVSITTCPLARLFVIVFTFKVDTFQVCAIGTAFHPLLLKVPLAPTYWMWFFLNSRDILETVST